MSEPTTAEICDCANTGFDAISTCQRVIRGRVEPPCDCECHKPTREQMCADLARAMGWRQGEASGVWFSPASAPEICVYDEPPDYFTGHEACHDLVVWLAEDNARWSDFYATLEVALEIPDGEIRRWRVMWCMTAEPAIIAEAAWQAITTEPQNLTQLF